MGYKPPRPEEEDEGVGIDGGWMRICEKHRERATDTLLSKKYGTEFDLCPTCEVELEEILQGKPTLEKIDGRKRIAGRPKTVKG
jgi:hypothetical protein